MVPKMIRIRGPVKPGQKVIKANLHGLLKGDMRFFNPDGSPFEADVPNDPFYNRLVIDGAVELVKPAPPAAPAKPGKDK